MPAVMSSPTRSRTGTAVLAIALLVTGCGGSASAAPTSTPTEAPTPTPFDVAEAFLAIVAADDFSARMEIDGTVELGVTARISGTITGSGDDSRTLMKTTIGTTVSEVESITSGGKTYARTSPGPWLEAEPGSTGNDESFTEWLSALDEIEDLGVETKDGRKLHHLSVGDEPVPPEVLGLDPSTFTDTEVTIDFYAEDDGTPAVFTVDGTWVQAIEGRDINVEFIMDMVISNVGSAITIDPPMNVWSRYESPLGYTMANPESFGVENRDGYDAFVQDGADWIYVATWPEAAGLNADGFLTEILALVQADWGDPVETPVATTLAGEPGYLATFRYAFDDGSEGIAYDVLAMHGNVGWDLTLYTLPGLERRDFALFEQFLATFGYVD